MAADLDRRAFLTGIGATAVAPLLSAPALAAEQGSGYAYRTSSDLVAALADKKVSSHELVDAAIARIEALDPKINAVVVRDFDRARAAAKAADEALAKGEKKPLLGLPMTVKEQFNVAGIPTCWGEPEYKDWKPDVDALAVQRLKAAGAIILGKTNVPKGLTDWQSYNDVYGTTNNPWDFGRTSGGSAAALAAGFAPLELGSDIGGSLRAPAHFCGICAHKPSLDLVPQRGSGPPQTTPGPVRGDMSVAGPMARNAAISRSSSISLPAPTRSGRASATSSPCRRRGATGLPIIASSSSTSSRCAQPPTVSEGRSTRSPTGSANPAARSPGKTRNCLTSPARRVTTSSC